MPENFDMRLFPEGSYRLEAPWLARQAQARSDPLRGVSNTKSVENVSASQPRAKRKLVQVGE